MQGGSDNFVLQWKCILISVGQCVFASNVPSLFKDWFVWLFKKKLLGKAWECFKNECLRLFALSFVWSQERFHNCSPAEKFQEHQQSHSTFIPKAWTDRCLVYNKRMKTLELKQNYRLNECLPFTFSLSRSSWLRFSLAVRYSWNSLKPIDWNMPCW